jgi:hypothetical protein
MHAFEAWLEQVRIELDEDGVTADPAAIKKLTGMLTRDLFRLSAPDRLHQPARTPDRAVAASLTGMSRG